MGASVRITWKLCSTQLESLASFGEPTLALVSIGYALVSRVLLLLRHSIMYVIEV